MKTKAEHAAKVQKPLEVTVLADGVFKVIGMMQGGTCPAEDFLANGEKSTRANRAALLDILDFVSDNGVEKLSSKQSHQVNKDEGIYEFIKGSLRLFYFKGKNGHLVVCTEGILKKTQKVDPAAVSRAIAMKATYMASKDNIIYKEE